MVGHTAFGKTVAYVASTLPIAVLDRKLDEWGVTEVVLQGATHHASFVHLKKRHPELHIRVLPRNFLLNGLGAAWVLIKTKLLCQRVIFFHECCCPAFDILVKVIKPAGDYFPQVSLDSFVRVTVAEMPAGKLNRMIGMLGVNEWFDYYRGDLDNNEGFFFVHAVREYPGTIKKHSLEESREIVSNTGRITSTKDTSKKLILLAGRDIVNDEVLWKIYSEIVELAVAKGVVCYIKDHPAMHARLNFRHALAGMLDPTLPLELLDLDFDVAVGVASTGLLHFGGGAISIIGMLPNIDPSARRRRISHLLGVRGGEKVAFPVDMDQFKVVFSQLTADSL